MRFSIRQSFSLLHINRHRTTRSEDFTTVAPGIPTASALTRSVSLEAVDEYPIVSNSTDLAHCSKTDANPILHRVHTPAKSQHTSPTQMSGLGDGTSSITALQTANARLRDANATLAMEARILSEDLAKFSSDYYTEKNAVVALRREKKSAEEQAEKLESKLAEFGKFLDRLADLGLQEPVLARACDSLLAGEDADEALIGSIKEAATKEGTPWARIMPAVQGNRTSDEYLSAVNTILNTRKQLQRSEKVARFWKQTAQGGADIATMTPSPSDISQLVNGCGFDAPDVELEGVSTCQERGSALEDLMAILHRGDAPVRRRPPTPSEPDRCRSPSPVPTTSIPALPSLNINHASTMLSTSSKAKPTIKPKRSFKHKSGIPRNTSISPTPAQALAPLASKIFKEELVTSYSPPTYQFKFPKSSPARPVLADIGSISINNTNKPVHIVIPSSTPASSANTPFKPNFLFSAKALGKRRAVHIVDSQNTSLDAITVSIWSDCYLMTQTDSTRRSRPSRHPSTLPQLHRICINYLVYRLSRLQFILTRSSLLLFRHVIVPKLSTNPSIRKQAPLVTQLRSRMKTPNSRSRSRYSPIISPTPIPRFLHLRCLYLSNGYVPVSAAVVLALLDPHETSSSKLHHSPSLLLYPAHCQFRAPSLATAVPFLPIIAKYLIFRS